MAATQQSAKSNLSPPSSGDMGSRDCQDLVQGVTYADEMTEEPANELSSSSEADMDMFNRSFHCDENGKAVLSDQFGKRERFLHFYQQMRSAVGKARRPRPSETPARTETSSTRFGEHASVRSLSAGWESAFSLADDSVFFSEVGSSVDELPMPQFGALQSPTFRDNLRQFSRGSASIPQALRPSDAERTPQAQKGHGKVFDEQISEGGMREEGIELSNARRRLSSSRTESHSLDGKPSQDRDMVFGGQPRSL